MYARSVLVVEDDALVRSLIASHLEAAGFQVAVAANFTDALRLMKIIDPDGLILDIDLGPGPNGFDLAERVRRQSDEVAILFLTSLSDPRFANSKLDKNASSTTYINKHLLTDASALLSALEAALTDTNVEAHRDDLRTDRTLGKG